MTSSTKTLNDVIGKDPAPRMLTEEEVELLKQSKREIKIEQTGKYFISLGKDGLRIEYESDESED